MTTDARAMLAHLARAESHGESTVIVPGTRGGIAAGALVDAGLACVGGRDAGTDGFVVRVTLAGKSAATTTAPAV